VKRLAGFELRDTVMSFSILKRIVMGETFVKYKTRVRR